VIALSDEDYAVLERAAAARGESAEGLVAEILAALREAPGPVYYTTDAFLRHLGASDDEMHESEQLVDDLFSPDDLAHSGDEIADEDFVEDAVADQDAGRAAEHTDPR
jgi:hypothetical protein